MSLLSGEAAFRQRHALPLLDVLLPDHGKYQRTIIFWGIPFVLLCHVSVDGGHLGRWTPQRPFEHDKVELGSATKQLSENCSRWIDTSTPSKPDTYFVADPYPFSYEKSLSFQRSYPGKSMVCSGASSASSSSRASSSCSSSNSVTSMSGADRFSTKYIFMLPFWPFSSRGARSVQVKMS